jgi:electron transport complex protein RnfC
MRSKLAFKYGGIEVEARKDWKPAQPVTNSFLPNAAVVLLKQHTGPASRCLVKKGEYVREGMLVGMADSPQSANIHAPIPGVVRDIRRMALPEGGDSEAIIVALEGSFDRLGKRDERYLWNSMSKRDMLTTLRERGIVDTEPPGVPLHTLFSDCHETSLLILNAIESEPYLRSETCLMRDKTREVLEGFDMIRKMLSPERSILALDVEEASALSESPPSGIPIPELAVLASRYPQDMERQLQDSLCSPRGIDPLRALIVRPSSAFAIYEAIVLAKPMLERYVTIAGGAVKRPAVYKARIGTPIGDLIEECGGFLEPPARLILGGPIRGHAVHDLDAPITKTTSAVLALTDAEVGNARRNPCIRCGRCYDACPERLDPDRLFRLLEERHFDQARELGLDLCTLCGACGYICPSRVPLVASFASHRGGCPATVTGARSSERSA